MNKALFSLLIACFLSVFSAYAQWSDDATLNTLIDSTSGEDVLPKIAITPSGNIFICSFSSTVNGYNVRLVYLDKDGNNLWENPLVVSSHEQDTWISDFDTKVDQDGNCIITFSDIRNGNPDVFIYKISPAREFLWGANGIAVSPDQEAEYSPSLCITTDTLVIVTWVRPNNIGNQIMLTAFDQSGTKVWSPGTIALYPDQNLDYASPYLVSSVDGKFIMVFSKTAGMYQRELYARCFDNTGTDVWDNEAVINSQGGLSTWETLNVKTDGQGGAIIAWYDDRDNNMLASVFVQHIMPNGSLDYSMDGVEVSLDPNNNKFYPTIAGYNSNGELFIYWYHTDANQNFAGLYAQKIGPDGSLEWPDNGLEIFPLGTTFAGLLDADMDNDVSYLVYEKYGNSVVDDRLYALALDSLGNYFWENEIIKISDVSHQVVHPVMAPLSNNQWVMTWEDDRNGNPDIYAQNLHPDGTLGITTGVSVSFIITDGVNAITDAVVTLDGISNSAGNYVFNNIIPGTYAYSVSKTGYFEANGNVIVADSNVTVEVIMTGVSKPETEKMIISPNPFHNQILISNIEKTDKMVFSDVSGRPLMQFDNLLGSNLTINTSDFSKGLYFLSIYKNNQITEIRKVVKQ